MINQRFVPEGWIEELEPISRQRLNIAKETGETLQGFVTKCDTNYNLHVDLGNDMIGIIPRKEVEAINVDEFGIPKSSLSVNKVNKLVQFKVKEFEDIEMENSRIILSRKDVGVEVINWVKSDLKLGDKLSGVVKNITKYGAFVEIGGGIVGLLHIEDISVVRIRTPEERFKVGQKVDVVVKSIDKQNSRLILSYKELLGSWEENIENFEEKTTVVGIVREIEKSKSGIFVELKPNLAGLAEYKEGIEYGEKVSVYIKKIIPEKKKVKLIIV